MKRYFFPFIFLLFFSCGKETSDKSQNAKFQVERYTENQLENLSISIDTLRVDVGDELVVAAAYYGFGFSEDGQSIFFAEGQSTEVHEIDLKEMRLRRRIKFETDGPNQAPDFIESFQVLPGDEFLLSNYAVQAIFNGKAERVLNMKIRSDGFQGIEEDMGNLYSALRVSPDKKKAFSLPSPFGGFTSGLAVMDVASREGKLLKLPALELTKNFRVTFSQNNGVAISGDMIQMKKIKDRLVIYSGSTADLYVYDYGSDSLELLRFDHQLVANQKTGSFKTEVNSNEERVEVAGQMRKQITFYDLLWDESRQQYFRFGKKQKGLTENGEQRPAEVFLFSYDADFKLLGEAVVDLLPEVFFNSFFYEGKIYNYKPVEEDPGFVVMTLTY